MGQKNDIVPPVTLACTEVEPYPAELAVIVVEVPPLPPVNCVDAYDAPPGMLTADGLIVPALGLLLTKVTGTDLPAATA